MTETMKVECPSCNGTGLYQGFMERMDEAVICTSCNGTGAKDLVFTRFSVRRRKNGILKIRAGSGTILDNPEQATWISYEYFEKVIR